MWGWTRVKIGMAFGALLILTVAGWTGFQVAVQTDRIPGRALEITLSPTGWSEPSDTVTFVIIGDAGTGGKNQFRVATEMAEAYSQQPFSLLLTTGDNVYYGDVVDRAKEVIDKPYGPLFDAGVEFHPVLGNHDVDDQEDLAETLALLGMPDRYYYYTSGPVDFFALDSNWMDTEQLTWLADLLTCSENRWQVVYLHNPLYSSGEHGSDTALRERLEPILVSGGVDILFAGHDHNYERSTPQNGIVHVVTGGGAQLRSVGESEFTAVSESELHFMLVKASENNMKIQAIDTDGIVIDTSSIEPRQALASYSESEGLEP